MGRKPEYKNYTQKDIYDNERKLAENCKEKLFKEPVKTSEIAAYLSVYSRYGIHFDSKKVKLRIDEICNMSNGLLKKKDFRKDPDNDKSMYVFKPEVHGLLLTLLDTGYFDDRKNDRKLSTRENLYRDLTVNIKLYLKGEDRDFVFSNPAFACASCEGILSEAISLKMSKITNINMHSDESIRIKLMKRTYDALDKLTIENTDEAIHITSSKWVYSHVFNDHTGGEYLSALFGEDSLIGYLICLLALKVHSDKLDVEDLKKMTSYMALYIWVRELGEAQKDPLWVELSQMSIDEIDQLKEELSEGTDNNPDYAILMKRAREFFDTSRPEEAQLLKDLEFVTKA